METVRFMKIIFCLHLLFALFWYWHMLSSTLPTQRSYQQHMRRYADQSQNDEQTKNHEKCIDSDTRNQMQSHTISSDGHSSTTYVHKLTIVASRIYGRDSRFPKQCNCDGERFYVTNDTSTAVEADVVMFSTGARISMTLEKWRHCYKERKSSQLWILASRESPQSCSAVKPPADMANAYNLSYTYHSRSNFPTPYGWFVKFNSIRNSSRNWYADKTNLVQWTSSHCSLGKTRYARMEFVYALKEYINITMYGDCGDGRFNGDDYVEAVRAHKFALVLENSCCSEYITEKLWNALTIYYNVPVVYGATREEYERIAPPNSFIFVQDFSSLQELADYIIEVGSDEMKYNQYHDWRRLGYGEKQNLHDDRIYHCHSICRMSETIKEAQRGKIFQFDENSDVFFGGCRKCQDEINVLLPGN